MLRYEDMATAPFKAFAGRLQHALDLAGFPKDRERTGALAIKYAVSRETARKWLHGLSVPEMERLMTLAVDFRVNFEWLSTGRGPMAASHVASDRADYLPADVRRLYAWIDGLSDAQRKGLLQFIDG